MKQFINIFLLTLSFNSFGSQILRGHTFNDEIGVPMRGRTVYVIQPIESSEKVSLFKEVAGVKNLPRIKQQMEVPNSYLSICVREPKNFDYLKMGEVRLTSYEEEALKERFLYTDKVQECIVLIAFDPLSNKSLFLYLSRMEIRFCDAINDNVLERFYMPKIKAHFNYKIPEVSLISGCYSQDFLTLVHILGKHKIKIKEIDVPDLFFEFQGNLGGREDHYTLYIDVESIEENILSKLILGEITLPDTRIIFNPQTGKIEVSRP